MYRLIGIAAAVLVIAIALTTRSFTQSNGGGGNESKLSYTKAQADRGKAVYGQSCSSCHLDNLKGKVEAGGHCVITQLFYDNRDFFRFRERCKELAINVPIIPGILPITNFTQVQRITSLCKAKLPPEFVADLSAKDDADWQFSAGVRWATRQVQELIDAGVPGLHFYVLNNSPATAAVLSGVRRP